MRTEANKALVNQIKTHMQSLVNSIAPSAFGFPQALFTSASRLKYRLDHLESEQRAAVLELAFWS